MMFSKIWISSVLVLALCLQVSAHAAVTPVLGVQGTPSRGDVQRPNNANPCGAGVNIASKFDSSTAVAADDNGSFKAEATSFNGGVDGSLKFTAKVDASGTGTKFVAMTVTTNGDNSPQKAESQPLVASLPAGTKCTGGKSGDKCLVQFISGAGFGNCIVVSQATATGGGNPATGSKGAGGCSAKRAASTRETDTAPAGTRLARSVLAVLEDRGDEVVDVTKRGISGWIWVKSRGEPTTKSQTA